MENSEKNKEQKVNKIIEYDNNSDNNNENQINKVTNLKKQCEQQGLNEVGEYIGDRQLNKDPEEMQHLKEEKNEPCVYPLRVLPRNIIKLRSTIKLFIRDWAVEGQEERDSCYKPILEELVRNFPSIKNEKGEIRKVLIPGVGLARLLYEVAKLGFEAQGNEFSYFMLFCSNFVLNCVKDKEEFTIQPLIHSFSNIFWKDAPLKKIKIPDENLLEELDKNPDGSMSMVMGEFVEVYKNQINEWDSILTCFFIDTANNIISYIETIYKILKEGGVWINFGPLLYHYSEIESECSIELSWEEIKLIIIDFGFKIIKEEIRECCYSSDIDSMMKSLYKCVFFTAIKE